MTSKEELLDKVETFQNLLISYATGSQVSEDEFQALRDQLLSEPSIRERLPRFIRTCRDLKQFWTLIKQKSATYQGRREYLWAEFNPILEELEVNTGVPADSRVTEIIGGFNSDLVHEIWREALERRIDDPDGAITSARTLLESVCKHILEDAGVPYADSLELTKLYKMTADRLGLAPSQQTEAILRQVTGGCTAVVEGIGAMRNALGDAHGKGPASARPQIRHAELAVNLAGAISLFLIDTWESTKGVTD